MITVDNSQVLRISLYQIQINIDLWAEAWIWLENRRHVSHLSHLLHLIFFKGDCVITLRCPIHSKCHGFRDDYDDVTPLLSAILADWKCGAVCEHFNMFCSLACDNDAAVMWTLRQDSNQPQRYGDYSNKGWSYVPMVQTAWPTQRWISFHDQTLSENSNRALRWHGFDPSSVEAGKPPEGLESLKPHDVPGTSKTG